jgi:syntaxin-binding protein 5
MKKLVSIKGVIDNIRLSVNTPSPPGISVGPVKLEQDLVETLLPHQFTAENTLRHGFPFKAISMAFDPIQRLLAIGSRSGVVRIFGRPGVDLELCHEGSVQVLQILFIVNTGKLITACTDDSINLWDIRKKEPELVQSLMMKKERLTVMSLEFQDKWLYLGTERGNVYIMNVETFSLSGYSVSWNKCIDPLQKNHPGAVACINVNPTDPGKLLIGFGTGLICLWDLALKKAEQRYIHNQRLCSFSWHMEGRQFVCSYGDGSLLTWNIKPQVNNKPQSVQFVHGKRNKETGKMEPCEAIEKVVWNVNRTSGESFFVFSGG